ncbi:sensor histidine kinase [Cellulomonas oligotrophica]|uniref:histidine kinase n=1 Tax=Cellulomonas oligotrophica TaxID=931536 RepID=A0A7Y9JXZ1_9CELL|nr:HAMP domain-containing sensor histidine kinase [Cellulomonas oligotrophica]NYD86162.1 two-component system sensor histidine kinase VanS [Cellulomonas oligotrophica]GIG34326.1 two-component sensor histidine kinase [Cellulomonas oligotrophica]
MRRRGLSVRWRLALSYAALVTVVEAMLLTVVAAFLLRYVPEGDLVLLDIGGTTAFAPDRSDLLRAFAPAAALTGLAAFALGLLGGWLLAGRVLRPLTAIGTAARRAAAGSLSHRIALTGPHDELREVADTFDTMLARVEQSVEGYRRFAADASHELRTPLATTRAVLDVAAADPDADVAQVLAQLGAANARAVAVTEALLLIARTDAAPVGRDAVDLSLVLEDAVETLAGTADARGTTIHLDSRPAVVPGDETLLHHLATNLLQNAVVHNTATGGWVRASTHRTDGAAHLTVENTGPVLTSDEVAALTAPFRRGAGRTQGADHAGAGLGLAIARSIVRAHAGALTLTPRGDGGLVVEATLPGAAGTPADDRPTA